MTIRCHHLEQFLDVIAGLISRGLGFTSDANTLVINLTGSH